MVYGGYKKVNKMGRDRGLPKREGVLVFRKKGGMGSF